MNWKKAVITALARKKYLAFIRDTQNPEKAKFRLWEKEILPLLQRSAFWQKSLDFNQNITLEDCCITTYEDYAPILQEALNLHIQPFSQEQIIFWAETSATSGKRKYFPITSSFQKQFQRTLSPYFYSLIQNFPNFFSEKILYLAGYQFDHESPAGIPIGSISNFNYRNYSSLIRSFSALPNEVFTSSATFNQWGPLYALANDISAIIAITPMGVENFYKSCSENFPSYYSYLMQKKSLPSYLPPLRINAKRKQYLKTLDKNITHSYTTLWPTLSVICTWTSGPCERFARQLAETVGGSVVLMENNYLATEGWMTVPMFTEKPGILHPGAHIVEFIEEGLEIDEENLRQSWELEKNKRYEIFLTTAMGLVRYRLKDIVECTDYFNNAPMLRFCYKASEIRLETCSVSEQELREVLLKNEIHLEPFWYFASNSAGNKLILVKDKENAHPPDLAEKLHSSLMAISETYAHSVDIGSVLPLKILQLPRALLTANGHGQIKSKLISQEVIGVS
jgi:hypothetical protein